MQPALSSTVRRMVWLLLAWCSSPDWASGQTPVVRAPATDTALVLSIEGLPEGVQVQRRGATRWDRAYTNQVLDAGDLFRTGPRSRALLRFSNLETFRVDERSLLRIPEDRKPRRALEFLRGVFYFFHRDRPDDLEIRTRLVNAVVRGTEFVVEVEDDGTTRLHLIDGEIEMTNDFGGLELQSGQSAETVPGQPPRRTAAVEAINVIQWCLYYPGVLNVDELALTDAEQTILRPSLDAYRAGDLLAALAGYPEGRTPASDRERIFLAALLLSAGKVTEAQTELKQLNPDPATEQRLTQLAAALQSVIATVQGRPDVGQASRLPRERSSASQKTAQPSALPTGQAGRPPSLATVLLADSYAWQAQSKLDVALEAARQATQADPDFAFGWARVADLEFGFGRTRAARAALERSLELAPRNGQAVALKGFLLAADNKFREAEDWFNRAIALDGGLGNAWLGRGVCRIHRGDRQAGLQDLQVAATVEPQRALFRSYLGKAFSHVGDDRRASKELALAKELDPRDPTSWLYSALVHDQMNRINEAVRELEHSKELNDNRSVFRSRLMLDKDRAVRSANLAQIYRDAGMNDWSVFEAARGISDDYANYSAHLFLANSYDSLRDPFQINLRFETAWLDEYLVANLLAPAGAGLFTPAISQQEYSRLFEQNRLGLASTTDYFSSGGWVESGSQYGVLGNFSYALDANYRSQNLDRPNSDVELLTLTARLKQQITAQDGLYFQATWYDAESGDVAPYYYQTNANPGLHMKENEEPILLAGYHREWAPGSHTLFLAGWLNDKLSVDNTNFQTFLVERNPADDTVAFVTPRYFTQSYESEFNIYTLEGQQIWQHGDNTLVLGVRYQAGQFETDNRLTDSRPPIPFSSNQSVEADTERASAYAYYHWQLFEPLRLIGGLTYDYLEYPENFRYAPVTANERIIDQLSPKAGVIWTPTKTTTVRGAYAQALGGVSFDQSFRLEPTHIAGFNQAYRSIIPEAVAGANAAPKFELAGVALEQSLPTGTYLAVNAEWLSSEVDRTVGVVEFDSGFSAASTPQNLDYNERSLTVIANQLIGNEWAVGARYRLSQARLESDFPGLVPFGNFNPRERVEATLNQVNLYVSYNHPSGLFGQFESLWMGQDNSGYTPALPYDSFWQFNLFAGFRFPRRRAEIRLGVLNLTDQDYNLNPLNLTPYLWRDRTFTATLRFNF